jgi:hypothetical protein
MTLLCPSCHSLKRLVRQHKARCRNAAQIIIACIGADGPQSVEESATRIVAYMERGNKEAVRLMAEVERLRGEVPEAWRTDA